MSLPLIGLPSYCTGHINDGYTCVLSTHYLCVISTRPLDGLL